MILNFFFQASVKTRQPALSLSCVFFIYFSDSMSETLKKKIRTVMLSETAFKTDSACPLSRRD